METKGTNDCSTQILRIVYMNQLLGRPLQMKQSCSLCLRYVARIGHLMVLRYQEQALWSLPLPAHDPQEWPTWSSSGPKALSTSQDSGCGSPAWLWGPPSTTPSRWRQHPTRRRLACTSGQRGPGPPASGRSTHPRRVTAVPNIQRCPPLGPLFGALALTESPHPSWPQEKML